jgi:hypothetical protein
VGLDLHLWGDLSKDPLLSTMWTFPMAVQYGVALPFWVSPRTTPPEVNGDSTAPLSDEGLRIKTIAQHAPGFHDTLDTYILVDSHGGGVHATTFPLEDLIFARTDSALAIWRALNSPDSAGMTALTAQLARMAYDTLRLWPGPGDLWVAPRPVTTLTLYYTPEQGLMLRWLPVTEDSLGLPITPSGYSIWRFSPFWDRPDSVSFTDSTCWQVTDPPDSAQGFFEVRAIR